MYFFAAIIFIVLGIILLKRYKYSVMGYGALVAAAYCIVMGIMTWYQ